MFHWADTTKSAPAIKIFSQVLIFFSEFVYGKSDRYRNSKRKAQKYHIRLHDQQGGISRTNIGHEKRRVEKTAGFPKHRCNDNRHDLPHGSQLWRIRQPQAYGGNSFRTETLTMQVNGLHTVFASCFPPAGNREKQERKRNRMEAQPSEKMRLSQHLLFNC